MARKIIILERASDTPVGTLAYSYALWAVVPAARQAFYADATKTSAVRAEKTAGDGGITTQELADLRAGKFVERVGSGRWPDVHSAMTDLAQAFNDFQTEINNRNPWERYGTSWDGTIWTQKGAA